MVQVACIGIQSSEIGVTMQIKISDLIKPSRTTPQDTCFWNGMQFLYGRVPLQRSLTSCKGEGLGGIKSQLIIKFVEILQCIEVNFQTSNECWSESC